MGDLKRSLENIMTIYLFISSQPAKTGGDQVGMCKKTFSTNGNLGVVEADKSLVWCSISAVLKYECVTVITAISSLIFATYPNAFKKQLEL